MAPVAYYINTILLSSQHVSLCYFSTLCSLVLYLKNISTFPCLSFQMNSCDYEEWVMNFNGSYIGVSQPKYLRDVWEKRLFFKFFFRPWPTLKTKNSFIESHWFLKLYRNFFLLRTRVSFCADQWARNPWFLLNYLQFFAEKTVSWLYRLIATASNPLCH